MKTIKYIKTTDMDNMKAISKYQESIAYMVSGALKEYFDNVGLKRLNCHIWVEKYLLADVCIVQSYKNDVNKINVECKVQWLDTTKAYRIEVVVNNEHVFVCTLTLDEGKNTWTNYHKFDSQSETVVDFTKTITNWLSNL